MNKHRETEEQLIRELAKLRQRVAELETFDVERQQAATILLDQKGTIIESNIAHARLFGLTREEMIGKCVFDLLPPDLVDRPRMAIESVFLTGRKFVGQDTYAGTWIEFIVYPIYDTRGNVVRVGVYTLDITDRKRLDERLAIITELVDIAPACITVHDFDGHFLYANQMTCDLHGYTREDFLATNLHDIDVPQSETLIASRMEQIMTTGEASFEASHFRKDGSTFLLSVQAKAGNWGDTKVILSIATDITERKAAEESARANTILLQIAGHAAKFGGWSIALSENRVLWSDEVASIHGMPPGYSPTLEEGINFYAPESREKIKEVFRDCALEGKPFDEDMVIIAAGGRHVWVRAIGMAIRDESGTITKVEGAFQDITERKQTEEVLRLAEEKYLSIFENSVEGIFQFTPEGRFVSANPGLARMFGYDSPEDLMASVTDVGRQLYAGEGAYREHLSLFDEEKEIKNYEVRMYHKDGSMFWVSMHAKVVRDHVGTPLLYEGFVENITDRKVAEEELRDSENRYRQLSIVDDLTQLYNSRHFYTQMKMEIDRAERYKQPLTLLVLDLDDFKIFNDTYGHIKGDQVLLRLGQIVKRCLRQTDSAFRYGGEEFTILLSLTTCENGAITAERIRTEFKEETFFPAPDKEIHMTVSIGIAQYRPHEDMKAFVHRVDQLMYQAKRAGKNRVCSELQP